MRRMSVWFGDLTPYFDTDFERALWSWFERVSLEEFRTAMAELRSLKRPLTVEDVRRLYVPASATSPAPGVAAAPAAPDLPPAVVVLYLAIFLNILIFVALMYWHDLSPEVQATFTPVVNYLAPGGLLPLGWAIKNYRDYRKRDGGR
jgi:hypothetical protein